MKRIIFLIFSIILIIGMGSACAVGPVHGGLFTSIKFPGEFNPNNDVPATNSAEGCQHAILFGLAAWGDATAGRTANKNGIKRIATIDHRTFSVITPFYLQPLYSNYCTIVTGE